MRFQIGHPAYNGINAPASHYTHQAALRDLLRRGVTMIEAQKALTNAMGGSFTCCQTRGGLHVIELYCAAV